VHRVRSNPGATPGAIQTLKAAVDIAGALGRTSKMNCFSYGLPAKRCQVGSVLAKLPNTVCSKCYALRGNYRFSNIQSGLERRWRSIQDPRWVEAMTFQIRHKQCEFFRWHDSGDIQSLEHLEKIADVAVRCSGTRFWLPTREKDYVHQFMRVHGAFPRNLVVRVSGTLIDGPPPAGFQNTSTVVTEGANCPSHLQNNECGPCRACWDPRRRNISYRKH
jgi:hypothetical protein